MKEWSIILHIGNRSLSFKFNEKFYTSFLIILSIISSLFLYLNIEGYKRRVNIIKAEMLRKEKQILLNYLEKINSQINTLSLQSESIFNNTLLLSYIAENEIPKNFNKNMGTGGFFENTSISDIKVSRSVENLIKEKEKIKNLVDYQFQNIEKTKRRLNEKEALSKATPSIWPTYGYLTAGFGIRVHPIYKTIEFHKGIDIANHPGTLVFASAYGLVKFAGWKDGYGYTIIIDHGYGYSTKYAHLKNIYVKTGMYVRRGQIIGSIGSSGLTTGPHLHYEVLVIDKPVNPWGYLDNSSNTY
uniref:M23 family metallopeptidase n=1 Tax=candidate division WOR-3 bacterium TaxID=2052148 RepID=A0A7C4YEU5_UNCW3